MLLQLMESPLCSMPVQWAVWHARKFFWKMEQNPRVLYINLLRYTKQPAKVCHDQRFCKIHRLWLFSVFFVIQVSVTWLCMSYCVGLCETQWKDIPLQKETILHGPFTSKWVSVRGPVLRDLSLWEPAFADESHYFWLTLYLEQYNQKITQHYRSSPHCRLRLTFDLILCPLLCYKHILTCSVINSFSYKSNRAWADSLENYFALSLTDYWLHASLLPGHYGCVEALVTWGADVDMDIPHLGTALYTACVCQELECARKLLREGQFAELCRCLQKSPMWTYGLKRKD